MKAFTILCIYIISSGCKSDSVNVIPEDPEEVKQGILEFFNDYLTGNGEALYEDERVLEFADVAETQELVWEIWKTASNSLDEEKLISLSSLEDKNSGVWQITESPNTDLHYYYGSKGARPVDGFPLFFYLHGSGPADTEWETGHTLAGRFEDEPSAYFIPRAPNTGDFQPWFLKSKQYVYEKVLRQAFVSGDIDPNMVYFVGISEGGYGSQRLASYYADYLAGAGPMAGGEPLRNAPAENCRNTAFSLRTGANDNGFSRNLLTQYTKDEFERLESEYPGSFVHFIELIEGAGHGIDYSPTTPWLKQHRRNPYPKFVSWENFVMDVHYRKGFYNLFVNERSNEDESLRTYYELEIDGNDISLTAQLVTYEVTEREPTWNMAVKFDKSYEPVTKGKVTIYLCEELVDLNEVITLTVNGEETFKGKVKPERRHIVNSCAAFFDPARLYPAAIEVEF